MPTQATEDPRDVVEFRHPHKTAWIPLGADADGEEANNAGRKLPEMLLSSLQMQHLVVLAGSGCSKAAGGPLMSDLWKAVVEEGLPEDAASAATAVSHDLTDKNIEAFFSRVEAWLSLKDDDDATRNFLTEGEAIILRECSSFLDPKKLGAHKMFLHRLSRRRVRDHRLKVFTTNYDLCFERAASEIGCVPLDGFSFAAPRQYDPGYFEYDIVRRPPRGEDVGSYLEGVFRLYKLHGSVNWSRGDDGSITQEENPKPEQACLIYPASGKYQQSYTQPYLECMAQYLAALREPNTCLVVAGFGFNDNHLSEPIMAAVQSNPHLRLIVVDFKAKDSVETDQTDGRHWKRLAELSEKGEDVWLVNAAFDQFAELIPDLKALTPAQQIERSIQRAANQR